MLHRTRHWIPHVLGDLHFTWNFSVRTIYGIGFIKQDVTLNLRSFVLEQDFNSLWIVRIILLVLAVLWSLVELLRLPLLRQPNWALHSVSFRWQANICRFYILSSLGFLEPCFFLTALFLVHGSLRNAPFTPRKSWNGKVVILILSCCLPVFLLQLFLVVISPTFEFNTGYASTKEGYHGRLPSYFTQAFEGVLMDTRNVAVCRYPLLSTLVLAAFGVVYSAYFLWLGWRMVGVVINRCLQRRVYGLLAALLFLLPVHVLLLGMSVLSKPTHLVFELLGFFGFLTILLCTTVGEGILVIRPIADALAVQWIFPPSGFGHETDIAREAALSISLSVVNTDDDEASLVGNRVLGRSHVGGDGKEYESGRNLLQPINGVRSFADQNAGPFFSPDSLAQPGKLLTYD